MRGGAVVEDAAVGRAGGGGGGMVARRQLATWAGARGRRAVLGQLQRAVQPLGQVDAPQPTARRHLYTDAQVHLHPYLCVCGVPVSDAQVHHRYTTHTQLANTDRRTDRYTMRTWRPIYEIPHDNLTIKR